MKHARNGCKRACRCHRAIEEQRAEVLAWDACHQVGDPVDVRKDDGTVLRTVTRSRAFVAESGLAVIFVEGISGYYRLDRVTAVEVQPKGAPCDRG